MPGTITITVDSYAQIKPVAQRVLCWALTDKDKIRIDTQGGQPRVVIPEGVIAGKGALRLKRGGTDLVSGYVANSNVTFAYGNNNPAMEQNVNTCAVIAAQPNVVSVAVAGMTATVTIDNQALGTVTVSWGDGTANTTGVAQNGTPAHAYAYPGTYKVTVTDESVGTDLGSAWVKVPA